jgi:hypothetical protein
MDGTSETNIFTRVSRMEKDLADDIGGVKVKAVLDHLAAQRVSTETMLRQPTTEPVRRRLHQRMEAFQAAQRIFRSVWEELHGTELHV